jgi:hypothetical protein
MNLNGLSPPHRELAERRIQVSPQSFARSERRFRTRPHYHASTRGQPIQPVPD